MGANFTTVPIIVALLLSSCAQIPPPQPTTTPTTRATVTPPPPPSTPRPSSTPTERPTETPEGGFLLPLPENLPVETWQGIHVMPGAIAGDELVSGGYVFTTLAPNDAIEEFYIREMQVQGWKYVATGTTEKGGLFIVFDRGTSVSVLPIGDEAATNYVMIVLGS